MEKYKTPKEIQDKWIQAITDCGQSLIDNAEKIVGDYEFQTGICISIHLTPAEFTEISVETRYMPKSQANKGEFVFPPSGNVSL